VATICRASGATISSARASSSSRGWSHTHGNVFEWCEDVYDRTYYSSPEAFGPDPVSSSGSASRVSRGGSWFDPARLCRSAVRFADDQSTRLISLGFRAAKKIP